ncbi:capsular biosynthesis protein [Escherichia coli]|nr:capsular biosynthesis protein [Escherichia coli]
MQGNALTVLLSGKKYLLLQGPMGPFFSDVAEWLESLGRNAVNVVFNGGDRFYCRHRQYLAYYQTPKEFPGWLRDLHRQYDFDTILCFGDCRPLHKEAKRWAKSKGIRFLAFEEGYLRPQFITVEEGGVNAYSSLPRDPDFYRKLPDMPTPHVENLKPSTMKRIGHAMWYYLMGWHYRHEFPRYRHHKSFSPWYEARCWVRAYWRKQLYKVTQRKVLPRLMNELDQRYYLAVLQVYNDSQIRNHSSYNDVRDYINEVMYSFSRKAPKESYLVIKHHPMDRGHRLYRPLIKRLSKEYGLGYRLGYIIVSYSKSLKGIITMPFALIRECVFEKKRKKSYGVDVPLYLYADADKAERVKKHLSYQLGQAIISSANSIFGFITLPFKLIVLVYKYRFSQFNICILLF